MVRRPAAMTPSPAIFILLLPSLEGGIAVGSLEPTQEAAQTTADGGCR
ncbi:MAG: hypothetical protein ACREGG_01365 [Candidatus Saccharimonadales bacterium]